MSNNRASRSPVEGAQSRGTSRSPSSRPPSRQSAQQSPSPARVAQLQEMGRMGGASYAENNPTPEGRKYVATWMDSLTSINDSERPHIKRAALSAFDKVMKRKDDEAQQFWYNEGVRLGRGWALDHALSGMTLEDQRKGLREELLRRSRTYHERIRPAFKGGVWAGFDGAKNNMHKTVPRSLSNQ